jgi:MinD superfamily P-loop ATPase
MSAEYVYAINEDSCIECGTCRRYCPVPNAIIIDEDYQHTIQPDVCTGCGLCEPFCPVPETIFKISQAAAQSAARLKSTRRVVWRKKWHYQDHPVMGPITLTAMDELRDAE